MEDISTEAAVGKGTLYRYFKDKDELYFALLEQAAEQIHPFIATRLGGASDPIERLIAMVAAILIFFDEQPHLFELIQQAEARMGTNHPWHPAREWILKQVLSLLAEASESGKFTVPHPETTGLILLGGLRAIARFGLKPRAENLAEEIVQTVLMGAIRSQVS